MDIFLKVTAGIFLALILCVVLSKTGKDFSILLVLALCCGVAYAAVDYLHDIITFIRRLQEQGSLNGKMVEVLLKVAGIGLLSEVSVLICSDAGNAALGKLLQIFSACVIVWLCIPVFEELISLVESFLGRV